MIAPVVFFDFETTGMSFDRDRVTDVGLVRVNSDGSRETWQQLVNPGCLIPPGITELTGISNRMVAEAPSFSEIAAELEARLDGALLVAHNASFDMGFLFAELERCGRARRFPHACSVRLSRRLFPTLRSCSLDALRMHFGLRFKGERHRALPDAIMLSLIWESLLESSGQEVFRSVLRKVVRDGPAPISSLSEPEVAAVSKVSKKRSSRSGVSLEVNASGAPDYLPGFFPGGAATVSP